MLKKLSLEHFRNLSNHSFVFDQKTAVVGNNGVGKSNLVEAIRLLSVGKSFKTSRLDDALEFSSPYFRLKMIQDGDQENEVELFYGQQFAQNPVKERQLTLNGQQIGWNDFWGKFPSVLFVPNDIDIVIGSPQGRRRYLDGILWQTSREFRQNHTELSGVLRERSALLFLLKTHRANPNELNPWNELLLTLSNSIRKARGEYCEFLTSELKKYGSVFTHGAEISVTYEAQPMDLEKVYRDEVRLAQNLLGPHRDELELVFNDQSARRFTSRGQARAIAVVLKIAEAAYIHQKTGNSPLILLDDMFSELDEPTTTVLFDLMNNTYQIVSTSISENSLIKDWARITLP